MLSRRPGLTITAAAIFAALIMLPPAAAQATSHGAFPGPEYGPADVVRIQVQALADNDTPYRNAGIEVAFRFASPATNERPAPCGASSACFTAPRTARFLHHQVAHFGQIDIQGAEATQTVILTTANGRRVGYVFRLSKQRGAPCEACWMTDGVWRIDMQEA